MIHDAFGTLPCSHCKKTFVDGYFKCEQLKDEYINARGEIFVMVQHSTTKAEIFKDGKVGYTLLTPEDAIYYMNRLREFYSYLNESHSKML